MLNNIETLGLKVERMIPTDLSGNVDVNTTIEVEFNSELDVKTIVGNFFVLKDANKIVDRKPTEIHVVEFETVEGSLTYKNRSVIFRPINQLDSASRYIVYVPKESIRDFKGRVGLTNYIAMFETDGFATYAPCDVVSPKNNSVISSLDSIEVEDLGADSYIVQISRNSDFENGVYDEVVNSNRINFEHLLSDGSYYIRAKATNGVFGETSFFTIKSIPNTLVSDEDEFFTYQPINDQVIELLESFPNGINASEKSNLVYMKFDGIIPIEEIDFEESYLQGVLADDNDVDEVSEHGTVDGCFSVVHDHQNNLTYVIFIPDIL